MGGCICFETYKAHMIGSFSAFLRVKNIRVEMMHYFKYINLEQYIGHQICTWTIIRNNLNLIRSEYHYKLQKHTRKR